MRRILVGPAVLALLVLGACGGGDDGAAPPADTGGAGDEAAVVGVKGLKFDPEEVTISVGETVRWRWDENLAHNVVPEGDEEFGTGTQNLLKADITHTFDEPGTYDYECTLHTGMTGSVEVEE